MPHPLNSKVCNQAASFCKSFQFRQLPLTVNMFYYSSLLEISTSAKCWNSKQLHDDGNICKSGTGEQQPAWSRTHVATFKPRWSHTVLIIGDRLCTLLWSSGHISMERCFSKQPFSIWTSLTPLTHLDGILLNVCQNPENKKVEPRWHMWKLARHFNSTLDVRPSWAVSPVCACSSNPFR